MLVTMFELFSEEFTAIYECYYSFGAYLGICFDILCIIG